MKWVTFREDGKRISGPIISVGIFQPKFGVPFLTNLAETDAHHLSVKVYHELRVRLCAI